jgi:hypothetical protein
MMKKLLAVILVSTAFIAAKAQSYRNEWIDYSKTYYKVKIGQTGSYQITGATLSSLGLGSVNANNFRLYRNGQQVPLYTSVVNVPLGAADFIQFWGERNDGKPDADLYANALYQINDFYSLETDTAALFLVNMGTSSGNLRINNQSYTISGGETPSAYFLYTLKKGYKTNLYQGEPVPIGSTNVYAASFDKGEGWASAQMAPANSYFCGNRAPSPAVKINEVISNMYVSNASGAPNVSITASCVGADQFSTRQLRIDFNGTQINSADPLVFNFFDAAKKTYSNVALSNLNAGAASNTISFEDVVTNGNECDIAYVGQWSITYPRQYNFGGASSFEFEMPAAGGETYLEIQNFNHGLVAPVLFDLTNGRRYVCQLSGATTGTNGTVRVKIAASPATAKMVLMNANSSTALTTTQFTTKNFQNLVSASGQANYIIISNSALTAGSNPVELYRSYRSSVAGGGYNAKTYDIDELYDQFAYGIKRHPLSVKNFLRYARNTWATQPRFAFLIGKAVNYRELLLNNAQNPDPQNLVPTFGEPAGDNLLASNDFIGVPVTPIGRLSALTVTEVEDYLQKVQEYEAAQATPFTLANKKWQKSMVHVEGATDATIGAALFSFLNNYKSIAIDSLWGSNVITYSKTENPANVAQGANLLAGNFNDGLSMLTYYGHSSASSLDFNLSDPNDYSSQGKYPVFMVMGCNAGNFYTFDPCRSQVYSTLSETFVLARQRGAIAFIASSHLGVVNYLDVMANAYYGNINKVMYGMTLGEIMKQTHQQTINAFGAVDPLAYGNVQETALHGDPALKLNQYNRPDYIIEPSEISVNPTEPSMSDNNVKVKVRVYNVGRTSKDSVNVKIERLMPTGVTEVLYNAKIKPVYFVDSIIVNVPIVPVRDKGTSTITVTLDGSGAINEMSESNNIASSQFNVTANECEPIFPYNYSIVTTTGVAVKASTIDPNAPLTTYRLEVDTTALFNSPLKNTQTVSQRGGLLQFTVPPAMLINNTVYYWRIAPLSGTTPVKWNGFSFLYLPGGTPGFTQAHFYQHTESELDRITLDTATRQFRFGARLNNLFIKQSIYGSTYFYETDFSVAINGDLKIQSACLGNSVMFNVLDPLNFKPLENTTGTLHGSALGGCNVNSPSYQVRKYNFEYSFTDITSRNAAMNFMDNVVPNGSYVVVRIFDPNSAASIPSSWAADQGTNGAGNSLYHRLKAAGFTQIDDITTTRRVWAFVYRKGDPTGQIFAPKALLNTICNEQVKFSVNAPSADTLGYIKSPLFGRAAAWNQVTWAGNTLDGAGNSRDLRNVQVIGVNNAGVETVLYTLDSTQTSFNIAAINATTYPYLRLRMLNTDSINATPYQLNNWRVTYTPVPEGAIEPNVFLVYQSDTLDRNDSLNVGIGFRNVSSVNFTDSILVNVKVLDSLGNVVRVITVPKEKPLTVGDSAKIEFKIGNLQPWVGQTLTLSIEINPIAGGQNEQFRFNNIYTRNFLPIVLLPVRLISFNARPEADKVKVDWTVGQELNFSHYVVEYSADGVNFSDLGTVNRKPATNGTNTYEFYHNNPVVGKNYYRLRSVDLDGKTQTTPVRVVNFGKAGEIRVFPNPTADFVYITNGSTQPMTVKLVNALGQVLEVKKGNGNIQVDLSRFASGSYVLQIEEGNNSKTVKVQKQ